ncbi:MAG: hypothetical protein Q9195_008345 [Heterodermia aff. obscurata]
MVSWDTFAVILALVAIPLTTSPNAVQAIKSLYRFLYQKLHPITTQCERLQWADVPDGHLFICPDDCRGSSDLDLDADCLESTLGSFFRRAWLSPFRRNKTVQKPKQLNLDTRYVRSDTKLLKAYLLMNPFSHNNIRFHDLNGVLTAHLVTKREYSRWSSNSHTFEMQRHIQHRCTLTKREIELILEGYPPDYSERISIPQDQPSTNSPPCVSVPSPIREREDIHRGGWIIGTALHRYFKDLQVTKANMENWEIPMIGHVMESTTFEAGDRTIDDFLPRQKAVLRVRHVFYSIMEAMPEEQELVKAALELIDPLFRPIEVSNMKLLLDPANLDASNVPPRDKYGLPSPNYFAPGNFKRIGRYARLYQLSTPTTDYFSRKFVTRLSGTEWTRAMNIFNQFDALSPESIDFLRPRLVHILQAAASGVWDVYRHKYRECSPILPDIPELREGRHVYIYDCKQGQRHGEED